MLRDWSYTLYNDKGTKQLIFPYNYDDNLIVCRQFGKTRQFTSFKTYTHFQQHNDQTPESERCFYEVILGKKKRNILVIGLKQNIVIIQMILIHLLNILMNMEKLNMK